MNLEQAAHQAMEALESIRQYGLDTLSGRVDGTDDRDWQRAGVNEMTKRTSVGITALREALAQPQGEPVAWQTIDTAPRDNKRNLYLARFSESGEMLELDFDGRWEYWQESWELSHINGWYWCSAEGIEEPTHWAYQDEPLPTTQPVVPKGEWVDLTDDECLDLSLGDGIIDSLCDPYDKFKTGDNYGSVQYDAIRLCRKAIAKFKEKNK